MDHRLVVLSQVLGNLRGATRVAPRYLFGVVFTRSFAAAVRRIAGSVAVAGGLVACGGSPQPPADAPLPQIASRGGVEQVLLRFPSEGGLPRGYRWPRLDSAIWVGRDRLPGLGKLLAFDLGDGQVALATSEGRPIRLDLRTGLMQLPGEMMTHAASADGSSLYGLSEDRRLVRNTPTADWRGPAVPGDTVIALQNGAVVIVSHREDLTQLIRMRPPADDPRDTIEIARASQLYLSASGDRLYAFTARGVQAVDTRAWTSAAAPDRVREPRALVTTPSGDRVFVLGEDGTKVDVWLRYSERYDRNAITLPAPATALRMDPFGRFLLARAETGDSVYVVSVPLARMVQTVASGWRDDLPTVTPDGALLALGRNDVSVVDAASGTQRLRVRGGAEDYWAFVRWNGFRPRDRSLDSPAVFETDSPEDSAAAAAFVDSILAANAMRMSDELEAIGRASAGRRLEQDSTAVAAAGGYTVSFASLLSESAARAMAERIQIDGRRPRVVATTSDGVTIYRVVTGPYESREAAVAAGRRSGVPFWVFAGLP